MAAPTTDNIKVAIRVRPLIKREFTDCQQNINWKVSNNTITQVNNGKLLSSSSYTFDRIFDTCDSTQDVYDEFGKPVVLSAMDGMNGTLFAYGQTSSGKTYTMLGDQNAEGVIPKAIGEIYEYIDQHPSREFLIRVSYMEIYNEDIRDLLNPTKSNLKIHENYQKQVYVGELTEEVVARREDVDKHMLRGEKNRHFGETNMNERSSRSHTIFRVVIESREMRDESKDNDSIDGAVRVAHLNLVDLAGSERASQTGAVGQRLREGSHINKSLLALGSVIAKLSEGDSFVPFRDSKLTRILQSSLGGNAKTSMICTVTPAAVEETISTLKFASRAKTIKNCPEVNEVLDDGTLLKRYRKEISELKQQLTAMSRQSTNLHLQELQVEKEKMAELLEQQRKQQSEQEEKIKKLRNMICSSGRENNPPPSKVPRLAKRRETWCPGPALSKISLAPSVALANHTSNLAGRMPSSTSSEEDDFNEIPKERFLTILEEEERKDSVDETNKRRVRFVSPVKRLSTPVVNAEQEEKEIQTEPDEKVVQLQQEVKLLRKELAEAIGTRDLFNRLLEESNALLDKMSEDGSNGSKLHEQVSIIQSQCKDLEDLKRRNKDLEDQTQSFESELTLANEYLTELQAEYEGAQAQNKALSARVEGLENTLAYNTSVKTELDAVKIALEENSREREQLHAAVETWKQNHCALELEINRLRSDAPDMETLQLQQRKDIENLQSQLRQAFSDVEDKERRLNEVFEQKKEEENSLEIFKAEKENELLKFKEEAERLERKLFENGTTLKELVQQKGETDEKLDIFKLELEQKANENQELQKMFERVKRERDEIKNDLSETITDTAELQKDMLGMQQKVKNYKDVIRELETERHAMEAAMSTEKEQVENLTCQLSLVRQEMEQLSKNDNNGAQNEASTSDESEDKATQIENLMSLLEQEKAHVEEVTEERNAFKDEASARKVEVCELREKIGDLEKQMIELEHACVASEKRFQEEKEKYDATLKELKERETDISDTSEVQRGLSHEMELQKMKRECEELARDLADEKKAHDTLRALHSSLSEEFQQMKNSLVQDKNRDINQQRVIDKMKAERRETICNQAQQRQELEKNLLETEKRVSELESQCTYLRSEKDLLEHRVEVANKKVEETKQEMRDMENLYSCHDRRAVTQVDDAKAAQKLKQLEFNMDLTKQKFEKAERRVKELEGENRQLRGADIRNGSLVEECDNMRAELQRAKQVSDEKGRRLNEISIEVTQLKAHVDKLSEENKKNRSAVEKKDAKIDNLEQKLWETEEQLKKEREDFKEQQTQCSELEELNSTIQVKHQELEHMTFLVDEREVEIEEVRSSLKESELKRSEMEEQILQKEQRFSQMEAELRGVNENLLEATNKMNEAERKVVQLQDLIQKHDEEVKRINVKAKNDDIETQELSRKIERLERELQDRDHKLLEVESELEYTKANCDEAFSIKEDLFALVGAYTKALAEEDVADVIVFDVEHLKTNLELHMRRISCLKQTAKSASDLRDQGQASNEEKRQLQVKLGELKASFESEKASLEEEIENIRNSLLDEKRRVIQLEENVLFITNQKDALEAELQRIFAENQTNRKSELEKEKLNQLEQEKLSLELEQEKINQTLEKEKLNQELEKEKVRNEEKLGELKASFESEKTLLKEELEELRKCLLDKKRMVIQLEEKVRFTSNQTNAFEAELRRVFAQKQTVGVSQLEKEKLNQELEKEKLTSETLKTKIEELVEELDNMKAYDSFKSAETEKKIKDIKADYQGSLDNCQRKLSKTEEELETTRARLLEMEKKSLFLPPTRNQEFEVLKKKCDLAEQKAEETYQMYERETKRLKAIIDEREVSDDPEAFANKIQQLQEIIAAKDLETHWLSLEVSRLRESAMASTKTDVSMATINQELETLRKKCELAEKKVEETYDMYERETERLKAIIDEQEEDPDGFFRQIEELQELVADRDSEIYRLKSEITHAKKVAVVSSKKDVSMVTTNQEIEALKKKCEQAEKKAEETYEMYEKETERLKAIIDEQEDDPEGFFRQIEELQEMVADKDSEIHRLKSETSSLKNVAKAAHEKEASMATINQELKFLKRKCELAERKAEETYEMYERETERLKAIIDEQEDDPEGFFRQIEELQEIVADKTLETDRLNSEITRLKEDAKACTEKNKEGELKAVRNELVQKDLILQQLRYDLFKLQQKHDDEKRKLSNEVKHGEEKIASLKLEIRRLQQPDSEDTITMMSGQPCPPKKIRHSEAGVVSNVAVYSLKATVGKLESQAEKLKEQNLQLEKEKSTLSLMNTEANNKFVQLTSDNQLLKSQMKKMAIKIQKLKSTQENASNQSNEGAALPLESRNTSILGVTTDNVEVPAESKEKKPTAQNKPVSKSNWLGAATDNVFKDEPNQCTSQ